MDLSTKRLCDSLSCRSECLAALWGNLAHRMERFNSGCKSVGVSSVGYKNFTCVDLSLSIWIIYLNSNKGSQIECLMCQACFSWSQYWCGSTRSSFWCAVGLAWRVAISKNISKAWSETRLKRLRIPEMFEDCWLLDVTKSPFGGLDICFRLPEFQVPRKTSGWFQKHADLPALFRAWQVATVPRQPISLWSQAQWHLHGLCPSMVYRLRPSRPHMVRIAFCLWTLTWPIRRCKRMQMLWPRWQLRSHKNWWSKANTFRYTGYIMIDILVEGTEEW